MTRCWRWSGRITTSPGAAHLERLTAWRPDVVVNSGAWTDVDGCARDPERAMRINGEPAGAVAAAATVAGALIVEISSNEVFDGTLDRWAQALGLSLDWNTVADGVPVVQSRRP